MGLVLFWVLMVSVHGVNWTHVSFGVCAYLFSGLLKVGFVGGGGSLFTKWIFVFFSKRGPCRFLDVIGLYAWSRLDAFSFHGCGCFFCGYRGWAWVVLLFLTDGR